MLHAAAAGTTCATPYEHERYSCPVAPTPSTRVPRPLVPERARTLLHPTAALAGVLGLGVGKRRSADDSRSAGWRRCSRLPSRHRSARARSPSTTERELSSRGRGNGAARPRPTLPSHHHPTTTLPPQSVRRAQRTEVVDAGRRRHAAALLRVARGRAQLRGAAHARAERLHGLHAAARRAPPQRGGGGKGRAPRARSVPRGHSPRRPRARKKKSPESRKPSARPARHPLRFVYFRCSGGGRAHPKCVPGICFVRCFLGFSALEIVFDFVCVCASFAGFCVLM